MKYYFLIATLIFSTSFMVFCKTIFPYNENRIKINRSLNNTHNEPDNYVLSLEKDKVEENSKIKSIKEIKIHNAELEQLGYEIWNFQRQDELCHACPAHLKLRSIKNKNIWIKLADDLGQFGDAPKILKVFEHNEKIYLIVFSWFEGQGAIEGSHFVFKFDQDKYSVTQIGKVYISHYKNYDRGGTGWKTSFEILDDRIIFTKTGYTVKAKLQDDYKEVDDKLINEKFIVLI